MLGITIDAALSRFTSEVEVSGFEVLQSELALVDGLSKATKQKGEPFRFSLKSAGPEPQDPTHKGLPSKRRPAVGLAHTYKQNIYRR